MVEHGHSRWAKASPEWTNSDHAQPGHLRTMTKLIQLWMINANRAVSYDYLLDSNLYSLCIMFVTVEDVQIFVQESLSYINIKLRNFTNSLSEYH